MPLFMLQGPNPSASMIGQIPASLLGPACLPVRAILFDKSTDRTGRKERS